ncbi:MAG: SpoIID/LytB domain-containing protein [Fusobacteriaceae bacterium]|jgi:stage II sporulation protein D|nr:SpoIID/LytB domain-containing protein [Fusobacteriaceae bacterium]
MRKYGMRYFWTIALLAALLAGCVGSGPKKSGGGSFTPIDMSFSPAAYELDYSWFRKNDLPIPNAFRGNPVDYLVPEKEVSGGSDYGFFTKYDEETALRFYKDLYVRGVGDNTLYWRWKASFTESEFKTAVTNGLLTLLRSRPKDVFMLSGDAWVNRSFGRGDIGDIENVTIAARGKSGVVTYIVVKTSKNTFLLAKEISARRLFAPNRSSTGGSRDIHLYGARGGDGKYGDNPYRVNMSILPSGYCAIEKSGGTYTIYGGGNGHGVGMSQYAAWDLTENHNYSYRSVLKRYYPGTSLTDMYKISGVTKNIRVGISSAGGGLSHSAVNVTGSGKTEIKGQGFKIDVKAGARISAKIEGGKLSISVDGKHRVNTGHPVVITTKGAFLTLHGLRKAHTANPSYRGSIELRPNGNTVRIVNEVYIEDYLKQVLPSEMPKNFGVEALKAQAVAARTYALSDFLKFRYKSEGFHVKDTVESQVYNNQLENEESNAAVDATKGEALIYQDKPADA